LLGGLERQAWGPAGQPACWATGGWLAVRSGLTSLLPSWLAVGQVGQLAGRKNWIEKLDRKIGSTNWIEKLDRKIGSKNWIVKLDRKIGSK